MSKRILLIEPPFARFMGFYRFFFPFSLSSLSAYLKREGHEVLIYDADHDGRPVEMNSSDLLKVFHKYLDGIKDLSHPIWEEAERVISEFRPDLIGISYMSTKQGSVRNLAKICREAAPEAPLILGGAHPSILYESSMDETGADYIVLGEGEETLAELIRCLESDPGEIAKVRGLALRDQTGRIVTTLPRPLIPELDSLPFPDRESLYRLDTYRTDDMAMIMTSRGCPFNCAFCSSLWERKVRNRSHANILAELEYLQERWGCRNIYFKDDTFTYSRRQVLAFCDALEAKKLDINWECLTRIELVDEELIRRMRETGLFNLKIGIETGSPRLLEASHKNISLDQIRRGAEILNRMDQKWSAFFMLGFPDESEAEIRQTHDIIQKIRPTYVSMSILAPYPGCEYYYDLKDAGVLGENTDWNLYDPFSLFANVNQKIEFKRFQEIAVETMNFVDEYNQSSNSKKKKAEMPETGEAKNHE